MLYSLGSQSRPSKCWCVFRVYSCFSTRLSNCAVGEDAKVGRECALYSCSIAHDFKVSSNSKLKNEMLGFSEIDFDELVL